MQVVQPSCAAPDRLVACLCASWCSSCLGVKESFAAMKAHLPDTDLLWLDIDVDEDLLPDDLEISTFPILLVAEMDGSVIFYGSTKPHFSTLLSLATMRSTHKPNTDGIQNASAQKLANRLVERIQQNAVTSLTFSSDSPCHFVT